MLPSVLGIVMARQQEAREAIPADSKWHKELYRQQSNLSSHFALTLEPPIDGKIN